MGRTTPLRIAGLPCAAAILLVTQVTFAAAAAANVYVDDFSGDPTKGRFVMEAEHYAARMQDAGGGWWEVDGGSHLFLDGPQAGQPAPNAVPGARGNYMESLAPGGGPIPPIDSSYDKSVMEYRFAVEATGDYRLYVRWRGDTLYTDSLFASIWKADGTLLTGAGPMWFTFHQARPTWIWDNRGIKDSTSVSGAGFPHRAIWTIAQPGIYTLRISQREAESALDAMVFQTEGLAAPSGLGPPESTIADPSNEAPVAVCSNVTVAAGWDCTAEASIDADSYDPDGDVITLTQEPPGPYGLGVTPVTLTVSDGLLDDTCQATVTVRDQAAPFVSCNAPPSISPWETPVSFTATGTDNCGLQRVLVREPTCRWDWGNDIVQSYSQDLCNVVTQGDTITILNPGGSTEIRWLAVAIDQSGNQIVRQCSVDVVSELPQFGWP